MLATAHGTGLAQAQERRAPSSLQDNNTGRGAGRGGGDASGALLVLVQFVVKIVVNVCLDWGHTSSNSDDDDDDDVTASVPLSEGHARNGGHVVYVQRLHDIVDGFLPAKKDPVVRFYLNLLKETRPRPRSAAIAADGNAPP